ncbi:hypothetical protein H6P81_012376 [Aristolochia fimbriata]|uniref:Uncharacterized protein n=1 Tax=Aristolochia fimbriata TaxID=158543 RepID=A0AAV7EBY1_ARIFI|nr:hypothetical protein H6P81_012376 [Aristolochia fimbriata]
MAMSGLGFVGKTTPFRPPFVYCVRKIRRSSTAAIETIVEPGTHKEEPKRSTSRRIVPADDFGGPEWKKLSSKELGITTSMIGRPTRVVLNGLKKKGFEVYLVGGCVRDLILKKTPKDFDIITTAELKEVMRIFSRCEVVGKRFPICHVHVNDTIVEVSSFSTSARKYGKDLTRLPRRPPGCNQNDFIRWQNCLKRDFTINGLMLDPYAQLVYDYMGGMEDIKKAKVRTVVAAHTSFQEDCARILRAIRIAARLGFRFEKETAHSIKDFASSVLRLDKGRLLMELNYMMAYGSAEPSLRLLWRFGLLEVLLPIQASYFVAQGFQRRDKRSNMLLAMLTNLDKLLAPNRPCHSCLWVGILAFHYALAEEHQDPLVVATFTLAVHNGGDLSEAVNIARRITKIHDYSFPELAEPEEMADSDLMDEVLDLASSVKASLSMMTSETFVSQAMSKYPQAPYSDLVFIPLTLYLKVCKIFDCVGQGDPEKGFVPKKGSKINYESLADGGMQDIRHTFARVVFDTVYPPSLNRNEK